MLISSSSRYSIYKVQWSVLRSRSNFFILSQAILFVKNFFKFFQTFSQALDFVLPSRTASIYYHTPNYLSSTKLKVFQLFSSWFSTVKCSLSWHLAGAIPSGHLRYTSYWSVHWSSFIYRKQTRSFNRCYVLALPIFPGRPTYCPGVATVQWTVAARIVQK